MTTIGIVLLLLAIVVFMFLMMARKGGGCCGGDPGISGHTEGGCCMDEGHKESQDHHAEHDAIPPNDPVCGMTVDPESDLSIEHNGNRYLFCSDHCLSSFKKDPGKYL